MKIYFTGSVSKKNRYLQEYLNIVNYLLSKDHKVQYKHITEVNESDLLKKPREKVIDFHTKVENWIKGCDFMIANTSFPSVSVGYEISLALRVGKPVLVFYGDLGPPSLLTYYKDERFVTEHYSDSTYKQTIDDFVLFIQSKSDLRFTFFITPQIATFLDDVSYQERMPKSVYIRKLIEDDLKKRSSE